MTVVRRVLLLVLALVLLPAPARADPPARLATQVTDAAGVLTGRVAVDQALATLGDKTGVQLFVVFVDSFDGVPAQERTDRTAELSDLGDRDALLAVATTDRAYAYSFPPDPRISDAELARVAERDIEPALATGDWSGAVVAAAGGYTDAAGGTSSYVWVFVVLALVIAGALLWVFLRRRRRARPPAATGPSTEELTAQANALLLELDDDLRASESELAMATAQYGEPETARFREALSASRADVAEAFRLRMTLEEEPAPDEEARRRTLAEIIARCRTADERLDAESEAFDQLRDLEGRAGEAATEVERRRVAVETALPEAARAADELSRRYAGQTVTAVSGNVDQARERLQFTTEAIERARAALASTGEDAAARGRAEAALPVRGAEQAVQQAEQLVAGVHRAASDLANAGTTAGALITELESEIAAGRAAPSGASAGLGAAVTGAEQTVAEVRTRLAAAKPDPVAAVAALQAADAALDRALAEARDAAERTARARALLIQALPVARAEVATATDFITTRRGAVGTGARASLSEAHRHLALAESLAESDPVTAMAEAQQAQQQATAASSAAHSDVQSWSGYGQGGYGQTGFDPGAFAGAVLGGILAGSGRSHSGGWGGGFGGSGHRTGGGGGGGGRRGGGGRF
ncbi:TPM domain-containing protein [Actinoplanes sp. NPDC051475]|uniref:TPM domain-containing protein n=1 Tax=Actinoplanes sp. NPDC051475 TaxID=3157225 RepID=UPI00344BF3F0